MVHEELFFSIPLFCHVQPINVNNISEAFSTNLKKIKLKIFKFIVIIFIFNYWYMMANQMLIMVKISYDYYQN
jgi:hypothetical protein